MSELLKDIDVSAIVQEVVKRLQPHLNAAQQTAPSSPMPSMASGPVVYSSRGGGADGVFPTVDEAVNAAVEAQRQVGEMSLDERHEVVNIIKRYCIEHAEEFGRMEMEESKIGRLDHKIAKLKLIRHVQGVEILKSEARLDKTGLGLIVPAPWGVIGMVTPATHSIPTMAGNAINVISAGNTAVFSPHPAASQCFKYAIQQLNRAIKAKTGINNMLCTMEKPTIEAANELFHHKGIALITVTGGPAVVKSAMKAGKRVIAAGPGNPPVVVDETANLDQAAKDIIAGASFDNNLLCIGEKEVFVVEKVAEAFITAMRKAGAVQLNTAQIDRLAKAAFTFEEDKGAGCARAHVKREFVGKDAWVLAEAAGITVNRSVDLLFGETNEDHAFVQEEQMMPFLPIVRVRDINQAIEAALRAEHGYRHTAIIHSNNLENVTRMAKAMNTTLFIHNGSCSASLGVDGPGYLSYSIATPTGEGVTTPLTFTRQRQLIVGDSLNFA